MSVYTKYFSFSISLASRWNALIQWPRAIVTGLFIVTSSLLVFPDVAISEDVKRLKYRYEGGYAASFWVRWITPEGITCGGYQPYHVFTTSTSKTVQVQLKDSFTFIKRISDVKKCKKYMSSWDSISIPKGSRVWGVVNIDGGRRSSCKSTKKVYFDPNGDEIKYVTQGTTKSNNRCFHTNKKANSTEEE